MESSEVCDPPVRLTGPSCVVTHCRQRVADRLAPALPSTTFPQGYENPPGFPQTHSLYDGLFTLDWTHVTTFRSLSATTFRSIGGGWRFTYALVVEDVMKKNAHCWAA